MKKDYTNGEITIIWQPDLCIHSANCVKGMPEVFKPKEKPWININNVNTERLKAQVDKCPSGALSYSLNQTNENIMEEEKMSIEVIPGGPLIVKGTVSIKHKDGSEELKENRCSLCRCGHSHKKPYCDGSHKTIEFE